MYCVVMGDIVRSRHIPSAERGNVQTKLHDILTDINNRFSKDIFVDFLITRGDEFQGVLRHPARSLAIIDEINNVMAPVKIRFGIGIGDMQPSYNCLGTDGEALVRAQKAVLFIETRDSYYPSTSATESWLSVRFETGSPDSALLNLVCQSLYTTEGKNREEVISILSNYLKDTYRSMEISPTRKGFRQDR